MATSLLTADIKQFVETLLGKTSQNIFATNKVIHDPILGTNLFQPHEMALLDLPFCQRLRRISQTDVASLVYPSANHNRLEHTLGVATIAGRIIESLRANSDRGTQLATQEAILTVRIAAILHDIGQGPFSHLSDDITKGLPEVVDYREAHPGMFAEHKPHEMLSYLIINDSKFQEYLKDEILTKHSSSREFADEVDMESIADMIIAGQKGKNKAWKGDIINGPFDADKLDYLQRDAYFSGLRIAIDLDRLLHTVWADLDDDPCHLKVMTSGAITLEQILFGKVLLYNTMYQHHKVLAAECAVKGMFEILEDNPGYTINGYRMDKATDFLRVSEEDILSLHNKPKELEEYIERFLYRNLFKRALVISADNVENPSESPGYGEFKDLAEYPKDLKELRRKLVSSLNNKYSLHDIWIVLPRTPTFSDEASRAIIQDPGGPKMNLRDPFKVDEWLTAYWSNKWTGYVFCPTGKEVREEVGRKAAELLADEYKFNLKETAFEQAKIR